MTHAVLSNDTWGFSWWQWWKWNYCFLQIFVRWRVWFYFINWQAHDWYIDFKNWWPHLTLLYSHSQETYLWKLKDLQRKEIIHLLDFAENYPFACHDPVQGFHWNNNQATVHPFKLWENVINGSLNCRSLCIISNERNHGAHTLHTFITQIIEHIKQVIPNVVKIHYFR